MFSKLELQTSKNKGFFVKGLKFISNLKPAFLGPFRPSKSPTVGSIPDLRIGGPWFNHRLSQYSFQGLTIVIVTGFIPLSLLSLVSAMLCGKTVSGLKTIVCRVLFKRTPGKHE